MFTAYVEILGYLAGALVLAAFCMPSLVPLRSLAILSNLAFIGYALLKDLMPVLVLHAVLLPVNVCRLGQAVRWLLEAQGTRRGGDKRTEEYNGSG